MDGKQPKSKFTKKRDDKRDNKKNPGTVSFVKRSDEKTKGAPADKKSGGKPGEKRVFTNRKPEAKQSGSQIRRVKAKVSDLKKKLMINYNKLIMKKKDFAGTNENKQTLVTESMTLIADKYNELIFKHDGCRILQALIKHGSMAQKEKIIDEIKDNIQTMMTQKYSIYLAQKAYYYSPTEA